MHAFLNGALFAAGFCAVATVFSLAAVGAGMVWGKAEARRHQRVIRKAMAGLDREDIAEMLRGDEGKGGGS